MKLLTVLSAATVVAIATSCGGAPPSPYIDGTCPVADPTVGYPVSVEASGPDVPIDYLNAVAEAVAYRWLVPSRRRRQYPGAEKVNTRLHTPEPRWADDWKPSAQHQAEVSAQLLPDGSTDGVQVLASTGDPIFDESLPAIFSDSPAWDIPFPPTPEASRVAVTIRFGIQPATGNGVTYFAVQQAPVRSVPNTARIQHPRAAVGNRAGDVTVKYDVLSDGSIAPTSLEILRADAPEFGDAVRTGMQSARFRPAQSNCEPIAQSVVQVIEFGRTG